MSRAAELAGGYAADRRDGMTSPSATLFRQLTRAVFAAQSSVLRYGDLANAAFGQSSARWRVLFYIAQGNESVAEIARETDYARQSIQRLADTLVADGLAKYAPDPEDRRKQVITLGAGGGRLPRGCPRGAARRAALPALR
jgi:DNA-binding MarR family transcriptional regulator